MTLCAVRRHEVEQDSTPLDLVRTKCGTT